MEDGEEYTHLAEEKQKIVWLENVREVLFQALLLDNVSMEKGMFRAEMCTIMLLR